MKLMIIRIGKLFSLCSLVLVLWACDRKAAPPSATTSRPNIMTTIFPLQNLVQQMTGAWADVEALMPPGTNPHDFEPTASQMAPLSRADMLIVVGLNFDEWAEKAAHRVGRADLKIERMADLVGVREPSSGSAHETANQHLWMDPSMTIRFVEALAPILKTKYPAHEAEIEQHKQSLVAELKSMDEQFRRDLSGVREKKLISYHNAYDLLANRYGLQVVAHLTDIDLAPGGEVTPRDLVEAVEAIKRYHLKSIYAEPQFPSRAVEMLHEQTGVKVLVLDDLGSPTRPGGDSYQAMMRSNVKALVQGQSLSN